VLRCRLIGAVWSGIWVDEANLRSNIGTLRKILRDGSEGRQYIQNVAGRGQGGPAPSIDTEQTRGAPSLYRQRFEGNGAE
jgi:DNA-binding winged helix-turn-helix (wHTH) protein